MFSKVRDNDGIVDSPGCCAPYSILLLVFSSYRAAGYWSRSIYELRLCNLTEISTLEILPHLDKSKCHTDRGFSMQRCLSLNYRMVLSP